jgi:hypothetical protein
MGAMRCRRNFLPAGVVLAAIALTAVVPAAAQQPAEGKTAEQVYKNIQVLKDIPADQINVSMHLVVGELGVDCTYCHVDHDPAHFALDDNPRKETARKMMRMVIDLNNNSFGGRQVVTCYTCHQGHPKPIGTLILPLPASVDSVIDMEADKGAAPLVPSVDAILDRYVQALGGAQLLRSLTSRVITATMNIPTNGNGGRIALPAQIERYQKAPDFTVTIAHVANGTLTDGFDGKVAWTQNLRGVVADVPLNIDQMRARRAADFYEPLDLKQEYARMEVAGIARVNGRDAYEVVGYPENDKPERLFFDALTGLLLRKITVLPSPFGDSPFQVDYDEYRQTSSGVRFPFVLRMTPASARSEPSTHAIFSVQKVQDNVPIDDARLARPQLKPTP